MNNTYSSQLPDRRRAEARAIGHAIFNEIHDLLPRDVAGEVHARLLDTIYRNGVLLVRDDERADLGLDPCDEKGWALSERVKFEQARISAMLQMAPLVVKMPEAGHE